MSLDVQAWALGRAGNPDVALPDLGDYTLTPIAADVGSISIDYPRDGRNFAALRTLVDEDRPVEIEARTDGTSASALRFLLFTAAGDDIKPSAVWTFTGYDLGVLLRDYVLPYNTNPSLGGNENGETSFSATAGVVMRTLMQRAQATGYVLDIGFGSFTNTLDSRGAAWAATAVVTLSPGTDLVGVLRVLADAGLCEWEVTNGRQLRLYNPGTRGTDRSLPGAGQLTLEHGRDIADAPVRHDVTEARTHLTTSGKDGLYSSASNAIALARIGWRRGGYRSFGNIADQGSLDAATQLAATTGGDGAAEQTHGLILESASVVVPGRDFQLGDWLLRGVNGVSVRRQVVRYSLARRGREITAAVTLGDLIQARAARVQRQIEALAGGSTVTGTSTPPPDVDDGKAPAAPAGLTGNSAAYYDGGTPLAQVTAAWLAVITNADGTAIGDLSGYEVQYRYQAGQNLPTDWQIAGITSATSLRWSPVVQARAIDIRVLAYDRYQRESAWSATFSLTTASDATAPPVLPAPAGSAYLGITKWDWNGKSSAGAAMPGDFLEAELHLSTVNGFTPDRPTLGDGKTLDTAASTTYRDRLTGAGELPVDPGGAYGVTWYAKWVAVDKSRNSSAASAQGSAVRVQAADGDLAGLNVGKLITGIMSALLTISGIIRTAAAGARVELDTSGLRCIAADGRILFEFDIPASLLTIAGRILVGAGIGFGRTIELDPASREMNFYSDATLRRTRIRSFISTDPEGSTGASFWIENLNASGVHDGPILAASQNTAWLTHRTGANYTGGAVKLGANGSALVANHEPGIDTYVGVNPDGNIVGIASSDGADGRLFVGIDPNVAYFGFTDGSSQFGYAYIGELGISRQYTSIEADVVDINTGSYRPIKASAFTVVSGAAVKERFEQLPESALAAIRRMPITRWAFTGDDDEEPRHVGPVVEDLPEWLRRPAPGPRVERRPVEHAAVRDDDGNITTPAWTEIVEVPSTLPDTESYDVVSMLGAALAAIRELDEEVDELRRMRGRPIPQRRTAADLLADVRNGRIGGRRADR